MVRITQSQGTGKVEAPQTKFDTLWQAWSSAHSGTSLQRPGTQKVVPRHRTHRSSPTSLHRVADEPQGLLTHRWHHPRGRGARARAGQIPDQRTGSVAYGSGLAVRRAPSRPTSCARPSTAAFSVHGRQQERPNPGAVRVVSHDYVPLNRWCTSRVYRDGSVTSSTEVATVSTSQTPCQFEGPCGRPRPGGGLVGGTNWQGYIGAHLLEPLTLPLANVKKMYAWPWRRQAALETVAGGQYAVHRSIAQRSKTRAASAGSPTSRRPVARAAPKLKPRRCGSTRGTCTSVDLPDRPPQCCPPRA
jgi:hypothetical protein